MYNGKRFKKSSRSEKTYKALLWTAAILKVINEIIKFVKNNIFD